MKVKSLGFVLVLLMGTTLYGQNRTIVVSPEFRVASFTGNANGDCWAVGRGVAYHSLRIEVPSTVTAGNVKLQGSFSSTCASPADIIADQDVTMVTAVNGTAGVYPYVQVVASGYMGSGTLRVTYLGDTSSAALGSAVTVTSGNVTADTELPAAAALADGTSNPTAPAVGAFLMAWNGTTWDKVGTNKDVCDGVATTPVTGHLASTTPVVVISAAASKKNYICHFVITATSTSEIFNIQEGTGTTCGTSTTAVVGSTTEANGMVLAATGGTWGTIDTIPGTGTNVDTCIATSGSNGVTYFLTYVQQ